MGDYYSIYNTLKILPGPKLRTRKQYASIWFIFLKKNLMDIEALQKTMVTLYNFNLAGMTLLPRCMLGFGLGADLKVHIQNLASTAWRKSY